MLVLMLRCIPLVRLRALVRVSAFATLSTARCLGGLAQAPTDPASPMETVQDLAGRLTPEQKQLFDHATKAFDRQHYADSLVAFKQLLAQLPGDPILSKFAAEAALDVGETSFAVSTVKPLAATNPNDWQAAALLTRVCAESGDTACRDSGMTHMLDLHSQGITPPNMRQYVLELIKSGANSLLIRTSLEPWGPYRIYDLGQVTDSDGKLFLRITLESSDADQPMFAKEYPKEAAGGLRRFSLDAYRETGLNSAGQRTQTHYTFKFFVGQPPYATVRDEFVKIAEGKSNPISSRTGLIVQ
jgi:hypothetical protein